MTTNLKWRKSEVKNARQLHMALRVSCYKESLAKAGSVYKKNHATVLNGFKRINEYLETDFDYVQNVKDVFMYAAESFGIIKLKSRFNLPASWL